MSPFFLENAINMSQKLANVEYDFSHQVFNQVSSSALDFISSLLKKNPTLAY